MSRMEYNEPPRMTFEGDEWQSPTRFQSQQTPAIVRWVVQYSGGYVKDEKQATYVLVGFAAAAIVIASILWFRGGGSEAKFEAPPGQRIIYPQNEPPRLQARFR